MKNYLRYILIAVFSFLSGWFFLDYLSVHPLKMSLFLFFVIFVVVGIIHSF